MSGRGRIFYCEDSLWKAAKKFTAKRGLSVSEWLRALISAAMEEK